MQTVIQFGAGVFLRGFFDWIVQIVNEKGKTYSEVTVIKPTSKGNYHLLAEKNGVFHIWFAGLKDGSPFEEVKRIDCIKSIINPYDDFSGFLNSACTDTVKLVVSNTTESGIYFDPSEKRDKISDSFPGKLTQWLFNRFKHFKGDPEKCVTILPCELIEENGKILERLVASYAAQWDLGQKFLAWNENNLYCSTLVDRIVSGAPSKSELEYLKDKTGIEDPLIIKAEPYHLWAIESPVGLNDFFEEIPESLNVQITPDISSFREKKLRILNGCHTSMVPVAYFLGARTVFEATSDSLLLEFLEKLIHFEIIPFISLDHSVLEDYAESVLERFKNPFIRHKLTDISFSALSKFKIRLLPMWLRYYNYNNEFPPLMTFSMAALILFYRGVWDEENIALNDDPDKIGLLQAGWKKGIRTTLPGILNTLWSMDELEYGGLAAYLNERILSIEEDPREALKEVLNL